MGKYCDLHTHSTFSDGTCTPEEIITMAVQMGLDAVALCDHNSVEGLFDFLAAAQGQPVEAVGGIELSTEYRGRDIHIVGLGVQPEHYDGLREMLRDVKRRKEESTRHLIGVLNSLGYELSYEELCAANPAGNINRAHVAAVLTEKGYTASIKDAFDSLIGEETGNYQPPRRLDVFEAISYLRDIGVVAILAHPFIDLSEEELEEFLPMAKSAGLRGMETDYATFDQPQRELAAQIALRHGLLCSGGSDFHGGNKPDIRLGRGRGDLYVPYAFLEEIKKQKS